MGFFDLVEKGINKGASALGDALNKASEATDGWGEKTDAWLTDDTKFDKVKDTINDLADKATEFFEKATGNDGFMKDDDIVRPEQAAPAPAAAPTPAPAAPEPTTPVATPTPDPAPAEPKPAVVEEEFIVVATTLEGEIVVPVVPVAVEEGPAVKPVKKTKPAAKKPQTVAELREEAKTLGVKGVSKLKKDELIKAIKTAKRKKS